MSRDVSAERLESDALEIQAIAFAAIADNASAQGRKVDPKDVSAGIASLLGGAWMLALNAGPDRVTAAEHYVALLWRHAQAVEDAFSVKAEN